VPLATTWRPSKEKRKTRPRGKRKKKKIKKIKKRKKKKKKEKKQPITKGSPGRPDGRIEVGTRPRRALTLVARLAPCCCC